MSRSSFSSAAFVGLGLLLVSCPSSRTIEALPTCDLAHHNADCHGAQHYCIPLDGSGQGRCVACRNDRDCDDGMNCNGAEHCSLFACVDGTPIDCGEGNACIEDRGIGGSGHACGCANPDADGDGVASAACGGTDCDDHDGNRHPGVPEACDAMHHDEDCDPTTFGERDADGDGHFDAACCNVALDGSMNCGDDCNDARADQHHGLDESCDGIDNDCDGSIDEGVLATLYADADGDGWGVGDALQLCTGQSGYAFQAGDCDDGNAQFHPGAFRCGSAGGSAIDVCGDDGRWKALSCPGAGECVPQPDGTGVCLQGTLPECADGVDNDGDGLIDAYDPDCTSPTDASEHPLACGDGIDNDGDHLADYPHDPGCSSREDDDEADPTTLPACANGLDDDGDGTADYRDGTGDPGCSSAADDSERDAAGPQCDNGIDDDGDTHSDFPADTECSGPLDDNEGPPACSNGIDDDGDGRTDFVTGSNTNDPGCTDAKDDSERGVPPNAPACDNGIDDDGDGAADYPGDQGCTGPADTSET
jgi:hypothetical protein